MLSQNKESLLYKDKINIGRKSIKHFIKNSDLTA